MDRALLSATLLGSAIFLTVLPVVLSTKQWRKLLWLILWLGVALIVLDLAG